MTVRPGRPSASPQLHAPARPTPVAERTILDARGHRASRREGLAMSRITRTLATVAVTALTGVGMAACASGGDGTSGDTAAPTTVEEMTTTTSVAVPGEVKGYMGLGHRRTLAPARRPGRGSGGGDRPGGGRRRWLDHAVRTGRARPHAGRPGLRRTGRDIDGLSRRRGPCRRSRLSHRRRGQHGRRLDLDVRRWRDHLPRRRGRGGAELIPGRAVRRGETAATGVTSGWCRVLEQARRR